MHHHGVFTWLSAFRIVTGMEIAGTIVGIVISLTLIFGVLFFFRSRVQSTARKDVDTAQEQLGQQTTLLREQLQYVESYAPRSFFDQVQAQVEATRVDLTKETEGLKETESKLDKAQRDVEERETKHQEIKTAREEDEAKLAELIAQYDEKSGEAIALEHKLAASLKNLDVIMAEASTTPEVKAVFQDLSAALTSAGSQLRDLITEYNQLNERLQMLRSQHDDLEEEYTKLVEQQLGE